VVTRQAPPRPPAPTVRPPQARPVDRLNRIGVYVLLGGVIPAAALIMALHRTRQGLEVLGIAVLISLVFFGLALRAAVRRQHVNPAAGLLGLVLVAAAAAWLVLPLPRGLTAIAAAWAVWVSVQAGIRHSRRRAVKERCSQVLANTKSLHAAEQVAAGLTQVVHRRRATEPHLGMAPGAAWQLMVTRWDGKSAKPRQMVLIAPALPPGTTVASPEFQAEVRTALTESVGGVKYLVMSAAPTADKLTINFLDTEPDQKQPGRQERAADRAKTAAGFVFKGIKVKVLEWDEAGEPENAPVAWPLRKIEVGYEQDRNASMPGTQLRFKEHMGAQLYGDTGRLRAEWFTGHDKVVLTRRSEFPAKIPALPWSAAEVGALYGDQVVLGFGRDEDGLFVGFQLTDTDNPHMLLTGGTGSGKSVALRVLMMKAARLGLDVRGCDPKRVEMRGLRGWPNVTRIATRIPDMIKLISDTYDEMHRRYDLIEAGEAHESDFRRILLVIDEFLMFGMLINDWWAAKKDEEGGTGKEHPVMRKLRGLIVMARGGLINLVIATQRGDAVIFPDGVRDSLGERVALGQQSQQSALMMFGDASVGRDIPPNSQGVGHTKQLQDTRIKVEWIPDPANWTNDKKPLSPEDRQLILSFLPPGSHWDGPAGYTPASPTSPEDDGEIAANPATRLLFFASHALRTLEAHVTAAPHGGAPAASAARELAAYGWARSPIGELEPQGTWIGTIADTPQGRRIYLHPGRTMDVASRLADPIGVEFSYTRAQLDDALRDTGLLATEAESSGKTRYTVRRQLPGNDLEDVADRQRVWDLPASEVIYLPDAEPEGAAAPSRGRSRRSELPPRPRAAGDDAGERAGEAQEAVRAAEVQQGMRIRVRDEYTGDLIVVTVDSVGTDPALPGPVLIGSRDDEGVPHTHRMSPDDPVHLAPARDDAAGDES
jgi:hypothetical protein